MAALRSCQADTLYELARGLPKVELHLHLHSGIRPSTLREFAAAQQHAGTASSGAGGAGAGHAHPVVTPEAIEKVFDKPCSLARCFEIFDVIHALVTHPAQITRITKELVEDMAADNVMYVELRTTPRPEPRSGMSANDYVQAVVKGLQACRDAGVPVITRLLLSINRTEAVSKAERTVDLALDWRRRCPFIVGVEISGNPSKGNLTPLFPVLQRARDEGLMVSIHAGEVLSLDETLHVLDFLPDRLGHMCSLEPSMLTALCDQPDVDRIPIEICPSSNVVTKELDQLQQHPTIGRLLTEEYPVAVCTDGTMLFDTTVSKEYLHVATSFGLTTNDMVGLARRAIDFAFCGDEMKARLRAEFDARVGRLSIRLDAGEDGTKRRFALTIFTFAALILALAVLVYVACWPIYFRDVPRVT